MVDIHKVRPLIRANASELEGFGAISARRAEIRGPGRPATAYYLNEHQALLVVMFSRTPKAAEVRREVIEVFVAWRRGAFTAPKPQPSAALPGTYLEALEDLVKAERGRLVERARAEAAEANAAVLRADNEAMEQELFRLSVDEYRALEHAYWTQSKRVRIGQYAARLCRERHRTTGGL